MTFDRVLQLYLNCQVDQFVRATGGSAGYDIRCLERAVVPTLETREEEGFYHWIEEGLLESYTEPERRRIEKKATLEPLNRNVFRINGDSKILVKSFAEDSVYPGSEGKCYYISPEGIVHYKQYEPFKLRTGIVMTERPSNRCFFLISMRSGTASRKGIILANGIGIIDEDYPLEWEIPALALHHDTIVRAKEKIAQAIPLPIMPATVNRGNAIDTGFGDFGGDYGGESVRVGGFGSTGY